MQTYQATVQGHWPIFFGRDSRELLLEEIEKLAPDRVFILTDHTVESLHAEAIKENIPHAVPHEVVVFNEGEENKNLATLEHVAGDLIRAGVSDGSLILNVGGGVVLNMGGLVTSLLGRGVRFAQIPTTFAAQWGSVNTNRQAIHFVGVKNSLGLYRSPVFSVIDPYFLETEPEQQVLAGLVEFVQCALVLGGSIFEAAKGTLSGKDPHLPPGLDSTLQICLEQSLAMGKEDPEERRAERLDAYGYTLGRALEVLSDGRVTPNEARYYGMKTAAELARIRGVMNETEYQRHASLMKLLKLQAQFPPHVRTDRLIHQLHGNNKTETDGLKFMLLEAVGVPSRDNGGWVEVRDAEIAQAVEKVRADA